MRPVPLLLLTLLALRAPARSPHVFEGASVTVIHIAHGQTIDGLLAPLDEDVTWSIARASDGARLATGIGHALTRYVFERPGSYSIDFHRSTSPTGTACDHGHVPDPIAVEVGTVRMEFDREKAVLSSPLHGGRSAEGIKLRVPVEVVLYGSSTALFTVPEARSAGAGTTILARPAVAVIELKDGPQVLEYDLIGSAPTGSYIMFDLEDINGRITALGLPDAVE